MFSVIIWGVSNHEVLLWAAILILFTVTSLQFFSIGRVLSGLSTLRDFWLISSSLERHVSRLHHKMWSKLGGGYGIASTQGSLRAVS